MVLALLQICLMDTIYIDNNFDNIFSIHATFKNYVNGYERKKEKSLWAEAAFTCIFFFLQAVSTL